MNILIIGAGTVGFLLAKNLSYKNNVIVVDINGVKLEHLQDNIDILAIEGNAENPKTFQQITTKDIDLFIAVTDKDETNLITTLIVDDVLNVQKKFIRLKNSFFENSTIKDKLNITELILPDTITARKTATIIDHPKANSIKTFENTQMVLASVIATNKSYPAIDDNYTECKIIGVERDKELILRKDIDTIEINDVVYIFGDIEQIEGIFSILHSGNGQKIDKCIIFGANQLGILIAKIFHEKGIDVKLIDRKANLCQKAEDALFGEVTVIHSEYGISELLEKQELNYADLVLCATESDEYNIIASIMAKDMGVKKVLSVNNEMEYYNIMHSLGITIVRGTKVNAYYTIMERMYSDNVITEKKFSGGKAVIFLHKIYSKSKLANRYIKKRKILEDTIVIILRDDNVFILNEDFTFRVNDMLVIFAVKSAINIVKDWVYEL